MSASEVDNSLGSLAESETEIGTMICAIKGKNGFERMRLVSSIEDMLGKAEDQISFIQCELMEVKDPGLAEGYAVRLQDKQCSIRKLKESLTNELSNYPIGGNGQITTCEVVDETKRLQNIQIGALDDALQTATAIQVTGEAAHVEIKRQEEELQKTMEGMGEMDSELRRGKKVLKNIATRAAGDTCLKILVLLVIFAILAVIVIEIVKPGSIKKKYKSWIYN